MRLRTRVLVALSIAIVPSTVRAQETVPRELMAILMRSGPMSGFDLKVGPPGGDFPTEVLPPKTRIGVTALSDRNTTVVGTVAGAVERLNEERRLEKAGWQPAMPRQRGFATTATEIPLSICKGQDFVTLAYFPGPEGGSYVRAALSRDPRRLCAPRSTGMYEWDVPMLLPPPGVRAYTSGGGGGMDSMQSRGRIERKQSAAAIAQHYAGQMSKAGWKLESLTPDGADFAVAHFTMKAADGELFTAFIAITELSGTEEMDMLLHVIRNKSDRRLPSGMSFDLIR